MSEQTAFRRSEQCWLIIDTRNGGLDGYYADRPDIERLVDSWKERLGHSDVFAVDLGKNANPPAISLRCKLGERYENSETVLIPVHAKDTKPPFEAWAKHAITAATELMIALYSREPVDKLRAMADDIASRLRKGEWQNRPPVTDDSK